jgi:hypothetical protein
MTPAQRFAVLADRFCSWTEAPALSSDQELRAALELLPALCGAALELPRGELPAGSGVATGALNHHAAFRRFGALPINMYASCDPLTVPCTEPGIGDLADDLADIYADVSRGLHLYRTGDVSGASSQWSGTFWSHWGAHAASALVALHAQATTL